MEKYNLVLDSKYISSRGSSEFASYPDRIATFGRRLREEGCSFTNSNRCVPIAGLPLGIEVVGKKEIIVAVRSECGLDQVYDSAELRVKRPIPKYGVSLGGISPIA